MDSLNRHMLPCYPETFDLFGLPKAQTPNLEAMARCSVTFDRHFIGTAPCMPARRELWSGHQDLLWRPWGSLEPWDHPHARVLRGAGVCTQLISDHYHLWERGGENYHTDFDGWDAVRGHENDPWITAPNPHPPRRHERGVLLPRYERNIQTFRREEDFPSPKTFQAAVDWLEENAGRHERFFLMIDEFDPHEPFHCPEPYNSMYDGDDEWDDDRDGVLYWPEYGRFAGLETTGRRHMRAQYCGKLTMADRWFGRFMDTLAAKGLLEETLIIVTTDHGHYLGEHDWWGKPSCPVYNCFANIPLLIHLPGGRDGGTRRKALTTTADLYSTILDSFGCSPPVPVDGHSLMPVLEGTCDSVRDSHVYGYWGQGMSYTDNTHTYHCPPVSPENTPLHTYSQRWSTAPWWRLPPLDHRAEAGRYLPYTDDLLFRRPILPDEQPYIHAGGAAVWEGWRLDGPLLFNLDTDWHEARTITDPALQQNYRNALRQELRSRNAPPEHEQRLGL
jgi:arylsulfatase A-like enzyme